MKIAAIYLSGVVEIESDFNFKNKIVVFYFNNIYLYKYIVFTALLVSTWTCEIKITIIFFVFILFIFRLKTHQNLLF